MGIRNLEKEIPGLCEKCHGKGWVWAFELDFISDWIEYPLGDTREYNCDGEVCKKYDEHR